MTVARIDACFSALKAQNKAAFIAYVMAGDPDPATSATILDGLVTAGADLIEVGFPFSDPMAEGPTIQLASQRALEAGMTLRKVLDMVADFRTRHADVPVILMGYLNPVLSFGFYAFAAEAAKAGVDGVIIVDCPPEEADPLIDALDQHQLALIRLAAPTTDDARLPRVIQRTSGFLYYVSVAGVTGVKEADAAGIAPAVARVQAASGLPVAVGFGIKTPERAAEIARIADAAVVGSALVDDIAQAVGRHEPAHKAVLERATVLAQAVHTARVNA